MSFVTTSERKCECLTFLLTILVHTDATLIVSAHQSTYKAEMLTQNQSGAKFYGIKQKAAQLISQIVDSSTSTYKNIINFARVQRLGWYSHIERMQETRMV